MNLALVVSLLFAGAALGVGLMIVASLVGYWLHERAKAYPSLDEYEPPPMVRFNPNAKPFRQEWRQ